MSSTPTVTLKWGKGLASALCFEPEDIGGGLPLHRQLPLQLHARHSQPSSCIPLHIICIQYDRITCLTRVLVRLVQHCIDPKAYRARRLQCPRLVSSRHRTIVLRGATIACSPSCLISCFLFSSQLNLTFYFTSSWTYVAMH